MVSGIVAIVMRVRILHLARADDAETWTLYVKWSNGQSESAADNDVDLIHGTADVEIHTEPGARQRSPARSLPCLYTPVVRTLMQSDGRLGQPRSLQD